MKEQDESKIVKVDELRSKDTSIIINNQDIVLKRLVMKDALFARNLLKEDISSFDFTCKLLFNQLINPKIDFEEFKKFSDGEIEEIGREFVKNDRLLINVFTYDHTDFFKNFELAFEKYLKIIFETMHNSFKTISSVRSVYPINIPKIAQLTPTVPNFIDNIAKMNTGMQKMYFGPDFANSVNSVVNSLSYQKSIFENYYKPVVDFTKNWFSVNSSLLNSFNNQFSSLQRKNIDLGVVKNILNEYQWFITPSLLEDFVSELVTIGIQEGNQRAAINSLYYSYFSENNFAKLEEMFFRWVSTGLLKDKREKIIQHCIELLKSSSLINPSYLIVPTLVPQIEGIQTEFMISNGLKRLSENQWKDDNGQKIFRSEFFDMQCDGMTSLESAKDIFFNVLFESVWHGDPVSYPVTFNRHKIAHGEHINYGTKYNIIRAFLMIDFLMWLYDGNNNENED